jgi:hypothetical protein
MPQSVFAETRMTYSHGGSPTDVTESVRRRPCVRDCLGTPSHTHTSTLVSCCSTSSPPRLPLPPDPLVLPCRLRGGPYATSGAKRAAERLLERQRPDRCAAARAPRSQPPAFCAPRRRISAHPRAILSNKQVQRDRRPGEVGVDTIPRRSTIEWTVR